MESQNHRAIPILNDLLEINNDRIEGYYTALKETDDQGLKSTFVKLKDTSEKCKQELVEEITRFDEEPKRGTRTSGKLFRVWMDLKTTLGGKDREAILKLCEQGEDVAVSTYQKVLNNVPAENLSLDQISMVDRHYKMIKSDHDLVRSLRDAALRKQK